MIPFANSTNVNLTFSFGTTINCSVWSVTYANNTAVDLSLDTMQLAYSNTIWNSWSGITANVGPFSNDVVHIYGDANGTIWMSNTVFNTQPGDYSYQIFGGSGNNYVEYLRGNLHISPSISPSTPFTTVT